MKKRPDMQEELRKAVELLLLTQEEILKSITESYHNYKGYGGIKEKLQYMASMLHKAQEEKIERLKLELIK